MNENILFLLDMLSYHIKFLHECALFSRLVQLFLTFSGRDQIHIITAFKLLYLLSRLVVLIQVHINCTNELVLRTVGASSSVTRRVLSENVDVIYDKSVMF